MDHFILDMDHFTYSMDHSLLVFYIGNIIGI